MHNELLKIGSITIYGYGLMIAIGILAAYLVAEYRAKRKGLDSEPVFSIMICAVVCGFAGAKLLYYITILDEIIKDPHVLVTDLADGFVVYGGIIAGILCTALFCRIKKLSFLSYMDLILPSVALAPGIWTHRLFSRRLLLRCGDRQCLFRHVPRFRICAKRRCAVPIPACVQRS